MDIYNWPKGKMEDRRGEEPLDPHTAQILQEMAKRAPAVLARSRAFTQGMHDQGGLLQRLLGYYDITNNPRMSPRPPGTVPQRFNPELPFDFGE